MAAKPFAGGCSEERPQQEATPVLVATATQERNTAPYSSFKTSKQQGMQTQVLLQEHDGSWNTGKTYPNPLLAYIAARKLSRQNQKRCRTVCSNGHVLDEIFPY